MDIMDRHMDILNIDEIPLLAVLKRISQQESERRIYLLYLAISLTPHICPYISMIFGIFRIS